MWSRPYLLVTHVYVCTCVCIPTPNAQRPTPSELIASDSDSSNFWRFVDAVAAWNGAGAATDEAQYKFVQEQGVGIFPKLSLDLFEVRAVRVAV